MLNRFAAEREWFREHPGQPRDESPVACPGILGDELALIEATPAHVDYVIDHLWERGRDEAYAHGKTIEGWRAMMQDWLKKSAMSHAGVKPDGTPVIVGGIVADGEAFTWFQCTEEFPRYAFKATEDLRAMTDDFPGKPIYIYSACIHPQTARWFAILGFEMDSWARALPMGSVLRRFVKR
jgi:hypothetical protein